MSARAAVAALLVAGGAAAGDADRLAACADSHLPDGRPDAEAACIGLLADPCLDGADGQTTLGIADCLAAESVAWDTVMNRDWPELRAAARRMDAANRVAEAGLPSFADTLLAAQRRWLAWREAECSAARAAWGDGSIRRIAEAECWRDATARRTLHLRQWLRDLPR